MKWNLNIVLVVAFAHGFGSVRRINLALVAAAAAPSSAESEHQPHHTHHKHDHNGNRHNDDHPDDAGFDDDYRNNNGDAKSSSSTHVLLNADTSRTTPNAAGVDAASEWPADGIDRRHDWPMTNAMVSSSSSWPSDSVINAAEATPSGTTRQPPQVDSESAASVADTLHSTTRTLTTYSANDADDDGVVVHDVNDDNDIEQHKAEAGDRMQGDQPPYGGGHQPQHYFGNLRRHPPLQQQQHPQQQQQQQQHQPQQPHLVAPHHNRDEFNVEYTRETVIKQGRLKGMVRVMHTQSGLRNVDQYLGIPYAAPPVGSGRFMPPGTPVPWHGVKTFTTMSPVCPQNLPPINDTNNQLSAGRYDQLKRLLPFLKNESEDCLFLNLYVPQRTNADQQQRLPVIVFIHGESFEWNSGNPYDGSVLASYGQVLVVTLNYRLGILGFLKPGTSDHTVSNFGLFDQIAALQWVKDNIRAFGGNNEAVTLMGHGTGAACVNLLMVSPVAVGLFHRAILMSGSALSDWAIASHPLQATMQIVQGLNCPLRDDHEEMLLCLRKKRYQEILQMRVSTPEYSTVFGPVVDNLVVPNQPYKVMGQYSHLFRSYDMLFGMTEIESYHNLNAVGLMHGLLETERDNYLRFYMQNRFEIRPDIALALTLQEYTDNYNNPERPLSVEHRDTVLEILSDARIAAPLVQTGLYHSKVNTASYMYVFAHNSRAGEFANLPQSVVGEDLPYVFGAPLASTTPFPSKYSPEERLLSEAIMVYWTNFAKTGNPKAPYHDHYLNLGPTDWERYDIDWHAFNAANMYYLNIGIPPVVIQKYKHKYMQFWNEALPEQLNKTLSLKPQYGTIQNQPYPKLYPSSVYPRTGTSISPPGRVNMNAHINYYAERSSTEDPYRTLKLLLGRPNLNRTDMYNTQSTAITTTILGGEPTADDANDQNVLMADRNEIIVKADATLNILIGIVIMFLLVNVVIIVAYLVKRNYYAKTMKRKLDVMTLDGTTDDEAKRSKFNDGDESYILDIVRRKNNDYEQVNTGTIRRSNHSPINGFLLARELSTSTMDAHTKVNDWMCHEIANQQAKADKKSSPNFSLKSRGFFRRALSRGKVSVAIDATPGARSASILQQEPVEYSKQHSFDYDHKDTIICQDMAIEDNTLFESVDLRDVSQHRRRSSIPSLKGSADIIKIDHRHSRSDPVQMYYRKAPAPDEDITVFIEESDINVTSREKSTERELMSPEEALRTIKRRNYPKVLPKYPDQSSEYVSSSIKRRSLPPQYFSMQPVFRTPPTPPPRTTSTLGRKSGKRESQMITTSPLMLAEEPPMDQEPEIACNMLHVGPLLPKSTESIYSTATRTPKTPTCHQQQFSFENAITIESIRESEPLVEPDLEPVHRPSGIKPPSVPMFTNKPQVPLVRGNPIEAAKSNAAVTTRVQVPQNETPKSFESKIPTMKRPAIDTPPDSVRGSTAESTSSSSNSSSDDTIKQVF